MKKSLFLFLFLLSALKAQEYVVVSASDASTLSQSEVRAIFLKKMAMLHGKKVIPINLSAHNPLRNRFENDIIQMSFSRLKSYWSKQHYLGHRPPISLKSQEAVIAFIKKVDGAIGYIEAQKRDETLHILYRWEQ